MLQNRRGGHVPRKARVIGLNDASDADAFAKQAELTVEALPFIGLLLPYYEDL